MPAHLLQPHTHSPFRELLTIHIVVFALVLLLLLVIPVEVTFAGAGNDWMYMREGALRWLRGEELYQSGYFSPPHVAIMLSPLALLPPKIGYAVLDAASLVGWAALARLLNFSMIQ